MAQASLGGSPTLGGSRSGSGSEAEIPETGGAQRSGNNSLSDDSSGGEAQSGPPDTPGRASASPARDSAGQKKKQLLKVSERKVSSQLEAAQSQSSGQSDSESEEGEVRSPVRRQGPAGRRGRKSSGGSSAESGGKEETWRDEFDDNLDDELVGDQEDWENLQAKNEKEREEEIFKRAERREELKKKFEISQKLKLQQQKLLLNRSDGELDSSPQNSSIGRKKGSKTSKFNALKAQREEKERKERARQLKDGKRKNSSGGSGSEADLQKLSGKAGKRKSLKASEIYSSSSASGDDVRRKTSSSSSSSSSYHSSSSGESDTERHKSKKVVKKAQPVDGLQDLEKIRLSRFKLDKFVHLPCFRKTVVGCFVRIGIGNHPEKMTPVYRVAEVMEVCETAKVYDVMKARTNIGLKLKHGKDARVFRLQFVSNSPFESNEFIKWRETCKEQGVDLPTTQQVEDKFRAISHAINYRFSSADVDKILASKDKFTKTVKNYAMKKSLLMKERDNAESVGDKDAVLDFNFQLEELEKKAEELDKRREGSLSIVQGINARNRKGNVERAEKCISAEALRVARQGPDVLDPFTRRKTLPVMLTMATVPKVSVEQVEVTQGRGDGREGAKLEGHTDIDREAAKASASLDIFSAHDFDVDININQDLGVPQMPVRRASSVSQAPLGPARKSLKIEEWKKRRGIM